MRVGDERRAPAALPLGKRPGTQFTGGWVGTRAGLDGLGKFRPNRNSKPVRPVRSESLYRLSYPGPPPCTSPCLTVFYITVCFTVRSLELNQKMNCVGE
jgi:hypothetical protein